MEGTSLCNKFIKKLILYIITFILHNKSCNKFMTRCATCEHSADAFYAGCKHTTHCTKCVKKLVEKNEFCKKCPTCTKKSSYVHTHCTDKCKNVTTLALLDSHKYIGSVCNQCNSNKFVSIVHDDINLIKSINIHGIKNRKYTMTSLKFSMLSILIFGL